MAKASPMVRSFNAGEFSELMEGRVDLDRYASSAHRLFNTVAAPQGPAICRSGTEFITPVSGNAADVALLSFVFSNEQALIIEVASGRMRFLDENGLQVYTPVAATVRPAAGGFLVVRSAALITDGVIVGDELQLSGFAAASSLNNNVGRVTAISANDVTLDLAHSPVLVTGQAVSVAKVYRIASPYTASQRRSLRYVQSVDVIYLLAAGVPPRKLSRYGAFDWRLEVINFIDGPYMNVNDTATKLTPSGTSNAVPLMTSDTAPSGVAAASSSRAEYLGEPAHPVNVFGRDITYSLAALEPWHAFTDRDTRYWGPNNSQTGELQYTPAVPFACDGYSIYPSLDSRDMSYTLKDYAPGKFFFEGYNGTTWDVLDQQDDYVLYDGNKSMFFELKNETVYQSYRLRITKTTRNGPIEPRIRRFVMRSASRANITFTAADKIGINRDRGFLPSDVGRSLRFKGGDGAWREYIIKTYLTPTSVTARLMGEPLFDTKPSTEWRLGYWSDTTGWPTVGEFFEDRLWLGGSDEAPDLICASVVGGYEEFRQTDARGEVLDDAALAFRLNSRKLSRIAWMASDTRGMLIGTGSEEYTLSAPNGEPLTGRNIKARPATRRGSAFVEPVRVDNQLVYVQRGGRTLREFAFVFEVDGYKSPSMSQLASHFGAVPFKEMVYAAEPFSIIWGLRTDGKLVGLTYDREENVVGWHQHNMGGVIETLAVLPQKDQMQDALWVVVRREVNGQNVRYIERLTRFWDFDTTLAEAHFVDSGLRYVGPETNVVYGLSHLEGKPVYGLVNNDPFGPVFVVNGSVNLPRPGTNIVVGLGFDSEVILPRLENGAADGTAQGKTKRINRVVVNVWRSYGGEVGVYNEQEDSVVYEPLKYEGRLDTFEEISLYTGMIGPVTPSLGYDKEGRVAFRRPRTSPLPFNMLSLMPQLNTQDR